MMAVVVAVFESAGLVFSENMMETMLQTRDRASRAPPLVIEVAGPKHKQTMEYLYFGGVIHEDADFMIEIKRRVRLMRACYKRFGPELYDMTTERLSLGSAC